MSTTHLVSVDDYMHMTFEHDAEYVDGRIVPRPLPRKTHSKMQGYLYRVLFETAHPLGYEVWVDQRIRTQVDPRRYRIPDVCMTLDEPDEEVFVDPPFLCVEILSPDDSAVELRMKIEEYLAMGVSYVWVVDPISLTGEVYSGTSIERVRDGSFSAGDFEVNVASLG
jgi:Uma2 family endonuclease